MGKATTFIEINGRRYNPATGELIGTAAASSPVIKDIKRVKPAAAQQVALAPQPVAATPLPVRPAPTTKAMDVHRRPASKPARHHQQQSSKTLMRSAVSKPKPAHHLKAQTRTDILAKVPSMSIVPKWSFHQVDPKRLKRAERIARSQLISKFTPSQPTLAYAGVPAAIPVDAAPTPRPAPTTHHQAVAHVPAGARSMDIFQHAINRATAHEQPRVHPKQIKKAAKAEAKQAKASLKAAKRRPHHRVSGTLAISAAVLALVGFVLYLNKTAITMRYADAKAGFHATLPGYQPGGYAIGNFRYSPGFVAVNFNNGTLGRNYTLTQQSSNWNSQTLADTLASNGHTPHQTLSAGGQTIYVYGDNNAAWVSGGIRYSLTSNGNLTTTDIIKLANSL